MAISVEAFRAQLWYEYEVMSSKFMSPYRMTFVVAVSEIRLRMAARVNRCPNGPTKRMIHL